MWPFKEQEHSQMIQNGVGGEEGRKGGGKGGKEMKRKRLAMVHVLVRVSMTLIKYHDQNQPREEKNYFTYSSISHSITEGSQSRNL